MRRMRRSECLPAPAAILPISCGVKLANSRAEADRVARCRDDHLVMTTCQRGWRYVVMRVPMVTCRLQARSSPICPTT